MIQAFLIGMLAIPNCKLAGDNGVVICNVWLAVGCRSANANAAKRHIQVSTRQQKGPTTKTRNLVFAKVQGHAP